MPAIADFANCLGCTALLTCHQVPDARSDRDLRPEYLLATGTIVQSHQSAFL